jgi:hypothetical protein
VGALFSNRKQVPLGTSQEERKAVKSCRRIGICRVIEGSRFVASVVVPTEGACSSVDVLHRVSSSSKIKVFSARGIPT